MRITVEFDTLKEFLAFTRTPLRLVEGGDDRMLDQPVHHLNVNSRIWTALFEASIWTVRDLVSRSEEEILAVPYIGGKALQELKDALAALGLTLRTRMPEK